MKIIKTAVFLMFAVAVIAPGFVFAIDPTTNPLGSIDPAGKPSANTTVVTFDTIPTLIVSMVNWFAWFIAVVSVVMGLYAGFLFVTARGETAQLGTAKKTLLYAVIGIAVSIVSFSIIAITKAFL